MNSNGHSGSYAWLVVALPVPVAPPNQVDLRGAESVWWQYRRSFQPTACHLREFICLVGRDLRHERLSRWLEIGTRPLNLTFGVFLRPWQLLSVFLVL